MSNKKHVNPLKNVCPSLGSGRFKNFWTDPDEQDPVTEPIIMQTTEPGVDVSGY